MKIHYPGIVSPDVDAVCAAYEAANGVKFGSVSAVAEQGAMIAHEPLELPGKGNFAIYIHGDVEHGLWQTMTRGTRNRPLGWRA